MGFCWGSLAPTYKVIRVGQLTFDRCLTYNSPAYNGGETGHMGFCWGSLAPPDKVIRMGLTFDRCLTYNSPLYVVGTVIHLTTGMPRISPF